LAAHAKAAGVDVTLELEPEVIHTWHHYAHTHPEGRKAIDGLAAFVRKRLVSQVSNSNTP
jgi:phosphinothricin tripeptide acetyl hydrolase